MNLYRKLLTNEQAAAIDLHINKSRHTAYSARNHRRSICIDAVTTASGDTCGVVVYSALGNETAWADERAPIISIKFESTVDEVNPRNSFLTQYSMAALKMLTELEDVPENYMYRFAIKEYLRQVLL